MTNNRYTDQALLERSTTAPGPAAEYRILTQVPLEVRDDIVSEAHTMGNYIGGRWSSNLEQAVATWRRTGLFIYRERAKAHREAEAKLNEGNIGPRLILPMN